MDPFQWLIKTFISFPYQTNSSIINLPFTLFLATIFLILLPLLKHHQIKRKQSHNLPPSPPKLPIIGNLHQLGNHPHLSLRRLSDEFGPIIHLQLGEIPTVVVSSARLAKEVLKTHDLALASRPQIYSAKYLFYGCTDIAFASYGAYWRHIRKICILELLSAKRVQSFSFVREQEVARLVRRIAYCGNCENYTNVDISKMLGLYANDIVCRAAFGRDFSGGGEYDKHGFQNMLEEYQSLLGGFSLGDYFPSMEWLHTITGMKSRLVKTTARFDRFFDEIIKEHQNCKKGKEEHKDIVDVLLEVQKDDETLTMDNVKAIILDMFAAGTDTTFITLDWGMTELILNPRVMKKAQSEIRTILGDNRTTVLETDLPQMNYLKAIIKEIFRMHPPAPVLLPRESMEEVIIEGYTIPPGTRFFVNAWAIGRDAETWGENPDVFEPERFMGSCIDYKGLDFKLIPFGAGRRICPAMTFGIAGVELALAQLLHSFDWELPFGIRAKDLDMSEAFGITMHRTSHLIVTARPRFPGLITLIQE